MLNTGFNNTSIGFALIETKVTSSINKKYVRNNSSINKLMIPSSLSLCRIERKIDDIINKLPIILSENIVAT